jgi:hypothetical protein
MSHVSFISLTHLLTEVVYVADTMNRNFHCFAEMERSSTGPFRPEPDVGLPVVANVLRNADCGLFLKLRKY